MPKSKTVGKPRNYQLECGVYRFGRGKMFHKKAVYKFLKKTTTKEGTKKKSIFVTKTITGAKNGETRRVRVKKLASDIPTEKKLAKGTSVNFFSKHKRSLRASLTPGRIAIILAGVHKGKRVVVLKQLGTGLVLVTGPRTVNGCPLRRINQIYLLATSVEIDVSGVKIAERINDKYFKRAPKKSNQQHRDGEIFEKKVEEYAPSEARKADQAEVDAQILAAIKKHPDGAMLKSYMRHVFGLRKGEFPHKMVF